MTLETTTALRIVELLVPETLDSPEAVPFIEFTELDNIVCLSDAGHEYFHSEAEEDLPGWQDQADTTRLGFLAYLGDDLVGAVSIMLSNEAESSTVDFDLFPHPDHWHEGIEDALLDVVERIAAERGRPVLQTWTLHRGTASGDMLPSPTGFGGIPAHDRQTEFFLRRGFSFEQTERNSVFDLHGSFERVEAMLASATEIAGPDYRTITWTSPTPPEFADGFAYAISRLATDAPSAELVIEEEKWDAARVARRDARLAKGGHTVSVAVVEHVPTRTIVAYNELLIAADHSGATHQYGTLVLKEHRGRRLGTIVKCVNLLRWRELVPESPRVSTFNAEENRHMLDINEAIGFVPASYAGAWKKVLNA